MSIEENKNIEEIRNYLEESYVGARAMDDLECQVRIARALAAFNLDIEKDVLIENIAD